MKIKFTAELDIEPETPTQMLGRIVDGILDRATVIASDAIREKVFADTVASGLARRLDLWLRRTADAKAAKKEQAQDATSGSGDWADRAAGAPPYTVTDVPTPSSPDVLTADTSTPAAAG